MVTVLRGVAPIGAFPVGASFLVVGTTKGLILIGSKTLGVFRGAFFEEEIFSLLYKLRLEQGGMPKGLVSEFLASRFPLNVVVTGSFRLRALASRCYP